MEEKLLERIETNPKVMLGKPVIKGTRITVELILEKLVYSETGEDILRDYPFLSQEDIKAAILYAAKALSREEVYPVA